MITRLNRVQVQNAYKFNCATPHTFRTPCLGTGTSTPFTYMTAGALKTRVKKPKEEEKLQHSVEIIVFDRKASFTITRR